MSAVARRYAKAIFALAQEQKQLDIVGEQITAAADLLDTPELAAVTSSPLLAPERRTAIMRAVLDQLAASPLVSTFLLLLAEHRRLDQLRWVVKEYERLEDEALGRTRLAIRTSEPLLPAQRKEIVGAFERLLSKTVISREEVDPALLGGVVVDAEGKVYDGSVRTQLERLRRDIARFETHA